jgi:DNA-binding FadR family transcriptional regulator
MAQSRRDVDQRAADNLIRSFERQILNGELKDGQTLPTEREIVEAHGVSRTVAREAILALAAKGLVDARPRFRPVVLAPSYDTAVETVGSIAARFLKTQDGVKNLFDLRVLIEASLARQAAVEANKTHIKKLRDALAANEAAIEHSREFYTTDIAFHTVLYEVPDNPLLPSIHKAYTSWLFEHWIQMPRHSDRNSINYASHKRIFDAILMRDPDAAETALRDHMADAWAQVRQTF